MILTKSNEKYIDLDFVIDEKIKSKSLNELLLIVPTNRKSRNLKKDLISLSPNQSTEVINLETIGTFSTNLLFSESKSSAKVLSEAASTVLIKQSISECKLNYFSNYKKEIPFGTLERIKNVISEYKRHGITSGNLNEEVKNLSGSEKLKAEDISKIYEAYLLKCRELNVKEIGDIYYELNLLNQNEFEERFRKIYPEVNLIIINGFDEFTQPEIEIINSAAQINNNRLFLSFDYYKYNSLLFSHLDKCYSKLENKGFKIIEDRSQNYLNKFQRVIREELFNPSSKSNKVNLDSNYGFKENPVIKISASTREKEIEIIAKEIKDLIVHQKVEPHKICVAFNLINQYSPIIRNNFSTYGIPFNLTDRLSLSNSSPVISIINFLEIAENDYYYKNIFRALSGNLIQIANVSVSNLLNASVNLKIISGYQNWIDSINDTIKKQLEKLDDTLDYSIDANSLNKALNDIQTIQKILQPFEKKTTLREFRQNFIDLVYSLKVPERLVNYKSENLEENIKAVTVCIETISDLIELLELEYGTNEKFPLKFFLNYMRTAITSTRFNIKEKPGYGVQVTTLNEIRGLQFDYLFIGGMCEGDLPTRYTPEIFFSGSYVKNELTHQTEERYQFYQSLCSWQKKLYLTYPLKEERQELAVSNILTEFENLIEVEEKFERDYDPKIYSKKELLKFIGQYGVEETEKFISETDLNLEEIRNSIQIDELRKAEPFGESSFTGNISSGLSDEGKKKLSDLKDKEYSISQLETYAKCPYKYFAERILFLKPLEEPTEEIEALEMGTILHNILYEFYKTIHDKNIILQNSDDKTFPYAIDLIFKIAAKNISEANFNSPLTFYEKEKILGLNGDKKNSILYKFLLNERNNEEGFIPEYFEMGFGKISDDQNKFYTKEDFKIDGIKVRGKIDRIDVQQEHNKFKVVDYKLSGKKPSRDELYEGISLQLPLYMYAAKEMIKAQINKEFDPAGAEIYSLKFNEKDFGKNEVNLSRKKLTPEEKLILNEEIIEVCVDAIKKYVSEINAGKFNLSTLEDRENKVCRYCNFRPICRIQEVN